MHQGKLHKFPYEFINTCNWACLKALPVRLFGQPHVYSSVQTVAIVCAAEILMCADQRIFGMEKLGFTQ